jgi:hypothetical protein
MKATNETRLLEVLWNSPGDTIPGGGDWTDEFIAPGKILRTGTLDVQDENFRGIEFSAVITLGKLVPRTAEKAT